MVLLVGTLVLIAALVTWFLFPGKPLPKLLDSPDALRQALHYLRNRGLEGGELRIQAKDDNRMSVVISKHIVDADLIELRGMVTDEAMVDGGREAVEAALVRRGIAYAESNRNGQRLLTLAVRGNLAEVEVFVQTAMGLGFRKELTSDCIAYFTDVLLRNIPSVTGISGSDEVR